MRAPAEDEAHAAHERAEDGEYRGDPRDADQRGREEQARQRHRVGGRGDDGGGDVVEVPLVAHAEGGDRERDSTDDRDRDQPAHNRDHDEIGERDRVRDIERDREALGHDREQKRKPHGECDRRREVLAHERVDAPRQPECARVHGGTQATPERAEDVATHADRGRHEDHQAGQVFEGAGDGTERDAGNEARCGGDQERDESRADPGRVRA